jgi:hypothetical protein
MNDQNSPEAVVQRQLDAYNARDLEGLLATYALDARQYELPAKLLATGTDEIRARLAPRLQEANLHAHLIQRAVMGNIVVDYETVTRSLPEGPGKVDLVAVYEVIDGKIRSQSVRISNQRLDADAAGAA